MLRSIAFQGPKLIKVTQHFGYSTKPVIQTNEKFDAKFLKLRDFKRILDRNEKTTKRPFLLNCFYSEFDKDILEYPEVLLTPDFEFLMNLRTEFNENPSDPKIFRLCGRLKDGGFEFNETERASLAEDAFWSKESLFKLAVTEHATVIKVLDTFGSDALKAKYLERLINGNLKATVCFMEDGFMKNTILNTFAYSENNQWLIDGEKSHVRNAKDADIFLVVTDTCKETHLERSEEFLSLFLVTKDTEGVEIEIDNEERGSVIFNKVLIPLENLVGTLNKGHSIVELINNDARLMSSVHCAIIMRKIVSFIINYAIHSESDKFPLAYSDYAQKTLAPIVCNLHALEAMIYISTAMIDKYENYGGFFEIGATKAFAVKQTMNAFSKCRIFLGHDTMKESHPINELEREFMYNLHLPESYDMILLGLSYAGIKHSYDRLNGPVRTARNPLTFPRAKLIELFTSVSDPFDGPVSLMDLPGYLHPSLQLQGRLLESCVNCLGNSFKEVLVRNGIETVDKQSELMALSEILVLVYAITASLARASRSYCIGLQNSQAEIQAASILCIHGKDEISKISQKLIDGPYKDGELYYNDIGKHVFEWKEYSFSHPLSRNYEK